MQQNDFNVFFYFMSLSLFPSLCKVDDESIIQFSSLHVSSSFVRIEHCNLLAIKCRLFNICQASFGMDNVPMKTIFERRCKDDNSSYYIANDESSSRSCGLWTENKYSVYKVWHETGLLRVVSSRLSASVYISFLILNAVCISFICVCVRSINFVGLITLIRC